MGAIGSGGGGGAGAGGGRGFGAPPPGPAAAVFGGPGGGAPLGVAPPDLLFSNVTGNPMAQIGMAYAQQAVAQGMTRYMPGASATWRGLRYYFDVSNASVRAKLGRVLFPFRARRWARLTVAESGHPNRHAPTAEGAPGGAPGGGGGGAAALAAPVHDENAPELYVPTMAFVTYVLLHALRVAVVKARDTGRASLDPALLVRTSSNALAVAALELALLKGGIYALAVDGAPALDLLAFTGYKYVGLCVATAAHAAGADGVARAALTLYVAAAAAYFMINTLMPVVRPETQAGGGAGVGALPRAATSRRNYVVVLAGVAQAVLVYLLS